MSAQCLKQWRDQLMLLALKGHPQQQTHGLGRRRGRPQLLQTSLLEALLQQTARRKQKQKKQQVPFSETESSSVKRANFFGV